jgi:hypothetical protein
VIEDCNKGITNPNGVLSGITVQLVVRSDQVTPTLYNILVQVAKSRSQVYVEHLAVQVLINIQDDSKLASGFAWPISGNPDNNLESPCIYNCNFRGGFVSIWGLNREYPKILSLFHTLLVCVVAMSVKK